MGELNIGWPKKQDLPPGAVGLVVYRDVLVSGGHFNEDGTYTPGKKRLQEVARKMYDEESERPDASAPRQGRAE